MTATCATARRPGPRGFTIVELLIVITIIGLLIAIMTPAIQASREAARRLQCTNNLRQLGLAATSHLNAHGFFPSGGWGFRWAGDPERGFGPRQPGGWIFSIFPFTEEKVLWSIGAGIEFTKDPAAKQNALAGQVNKPVTLLYCPTRRQALIYPYKPARPPLNVSLPGLQRGVLKTDYAINIGDAGTNQYPGPESLTDGDDGNYNWPKSSKFTGVSFQASRIRAAQVTDGLSHTYLIGEKYLDSSRYTDGVDLGDNDAATQGYDNDMCRRAGLDDAPMQDMKGKQNTVIFGSAHAAGFNFVFCDGSVHLIDYGIDPEIHSHLANRADGQTPSSSAIH